METQPIPTPAPASTPVARRSRLLLRGESTIAVVGALLALTIGGAMGATAWWVQRNQAALAHDSREQQLRTIGDLVSQNAETLLSTNDLSAVRRMLGETAPTYNLTQCRVVLVNGQVIASSDPSQVTLVKLPESWKKSRPIDENTTAPDGQMVMSFPIHVRGRGDAELELVAPQADASVSRWEVLAGIGTIGAAAMAALLLTYRMMRSRIRIAGSIREALFAIEAGEISATALSVSDSLGSGAKTWNALVAERERFRKQGIAEKARETLGSRGNGKGDLGVACDAMSQGLVLVDDKNRVTYANGAAAVFLCCKRDELVGSDIGQFLQVGPVLESVREIASGAGRRRTVHDIERKDEGEGTGVLRFNVRPVRREDNANAMLIIEDITQQKVAEAARHSFVAQATHELRTPLTNIRLYVETAIDEGENDPATRSRCLNVINGETRRLERIVGEMLSVAEIEAGSFKVKNDDVTLATVFDDLQHDYAPQAKEKDIVLTFNLPPKLPLVKGDRDKILMALHNLVGNAMKYTPEGGRVTINVNSAGKNLVVEVEDTGIGISQEDAERLFERFYRAKDPRVGKITGTGLGLSIAREVVRLHGGDISVESQLNQGSTFTMTLPVVAEAA